MAIKDTIVSDLNLVINVEKLLNIHVIVFHIISLSNITDYTKIISLANKFKRSNSEGITWLKIMMLWLLKHFIETTRSLMIHIQVSNYNRSLKLIIIYFKMLIINLFAWDLHKVPFLSSLLILLFRTKNDWHVIWIKDNGMVST